MWKTVAETGEYKLNIFPTFLCRQCSTPICHCHVTNLTLWSSCAFSHETSFRVWQQSWWWSLDSRCKCSHPTTCVTGTTTFFAQTEHKYGWWFPFIYRLVTAHTSKSITTKFAMESPYFASFQLSPRSSHCTKRYDICNLRNAPKHFRRVRIVTKGVYYLLRVRPSVSLSTCISAAPTKRIYIKYGIDDFMKICKETSKFG